MKIISKLLAIWKKKGFRKRKKSIKERKIVYKPPFNYDYTFKIVLLGDPEVGKANLTKRFCYNIFNTSDQLVIGVDFHVKTVEVKGKRIKMQIWDLAGEERFRFLFPTYCLGASAVMIIYDITNSKTLDQIYNWIEIIREKAGNIPIILIGNKIDLEKSREISREKGIKIAEKYDLSGFTEISAKTGVNIEKAFEDLTELIINRY